MFAVSNLRARPAPRTDYVAGLVSRPSSDQLAGRQWVKLRRTQYEQMSSGLPLKADIAQCNRDVSNVPNPDSKHARRCAFRRRTSGNCEVFHIVALLPEYNMSNSFS